MNTVVVWVLISISPSLPAGQNIVTTEYKSEARCKAAAARSLVQLPKGDNALALGVSAVCVKGERE